MYQLFLIKRFFNIARSHYHRVVFEILNKINTNVADAYFNKLEAKAEAQYNKLVTDFYENGIGYYGEKR